MVKHGQNIFLSFISVFNLLCVEKMLEIKKKLLKITALIIINQIDLYFWKNNTSTLIKKWIEKYKETKIGCWADLKHFQKEMKARKSWEKTNYCLDRWKKIQKVNNSANY